MDERRTPQYGTSSSQQNSTELKGNAFNNLYDFLIFLYTMLDVSLFIYCSMPYCICLNIEFCLKSMRILSWKNSLNCTKSLKEEFIALKDHSGVFLTVPNSRSNLLCYSQQSRTIWWFSSKFSWLHNNAISLFHKLHYHLNSDVLW